MYLRVEFLVFFLLLFSFQVSGQTNVVSFQTLHKPLRNLVISDPILAYERAMAEIKMGRINKNPVRIGLGQLIGGNVKWVLGDLPEALNLYYQAIEIFERESNHYGLITTYNDLSLIYLDEKDYTQSLLSLRKAHQLNKVYGDPWLKVIIESNLGDVFLKSGHLDSAELYTSSSYRSVEFIDDPSLSPFILLNLGKIYTLQEQWSMAYFFLSEGLDKCIDINDNIHQNLLLNAMGDLMLTLNQPDSSYVFYKRAWKHALKLKSVQELLRTAKKLQHFHKQQNRMDSAYQYSVLAQNFQESLLGSEKIRMIAQRQHLEEIRSEELRQKEEQAQEARRNLYEYLIIIVIILILVGIASIIKKVRISKFWLELYLVTTLLLIFEFVTLLADSLFGILTHHHPLPTLLFLLILASFISPLHRHSRRYGEKFLNIAK